MRYSLVVLLLLLAACDPVTQTTTEQSAARQSAPSTRVYNRMWVVPNPGKPGDFEVLHLAGAGSADYWCAAGHFVNRRLGMAGNTRVYVSRPRGPSELRPGKTAVGFTVAPSQAVLDAAAGGQGVSMSITMVGYNLRSTHGQSMCRDSLRQLTPTGPWGWGN